MLLRTLPSVEKLRVHPLLLPLPETLAIQLARTAIAQVRAQVQSGAIAQQQQVQEMLEKALKTLTDPLTKPSLRRILNGSGVLLHTNAGRAPLPAEAIAALVESARGYSNLELSLTDGRRSSRQDHLRPLLQLATGAESALVVNNGAAAVLLALHALARGRQVLVSRGELVEIGGGFRIPEVLTAAGTHLLEVGTTNRTHLRDFEKALAKDKTGQIAAILQVHRSNFALVGFTKTVELAELATLAHAHNLPLIVDMGSGALQGVTPGLQQAFEREPVVTQVLAAGADLVLFSGDKFVGGPQAGIIVGKEQWIQELVQNAMARALRVDNLTIAALETVLRLHLLGQAEAKLPVLAAVALTPDQVQARAQGLADRVRAGLPGQWEVDLQPGETQLGGGTDPLVRLPTTLLTIAHDSLSAADLHQRFLQARLAILGRPRGNQVLLDVRSLLAGSHGASDAELAAELLEGLQGAGTV